MTSTVGYRDLVRSNPAFRRLWFADIASLFGDWFNTIALYTLIRQLTESPFALGLVFVTKMLPFAVSSLFAGVIADRFDRRRLMVVCDVVRAVLVLGFLTIDSVEDLPLLYGLSALQLAVGAVFLPARSAILPTLTSSRELLTANTILGGTWSVLLAFGAAAGGFATDRFGVEAVFVIDCLSYLISAWFIVRLPKPAALSRGESQVLRPTRDLVDGWRLLILQPEIGRIVLSKTMWVLGGGALVYMLTLAGERILPTAPSTGIGLLYAARGVGTGIGPVLARWWFPDEESWPRLIGWGIFTSGVAYGLFAVSPVGLWAALLVLLAHAPSGANWVLSTVMIQRRTKEAFLGRVSAIELQLVTLADTCTILVASLLLERGWLSLAEAVAAFSLLMMVSGLVWLLVVVPREDAWQIRSSSVLQRNQN